MEAFQALSQLANIVGSISACIYAIYLAGAKDDWLKAAVFMALAAYMRAGITR